ncbi:hypothetical protein Gasu2_18060 [Galdieria sulphuraria]|uniref:Armadillo repeat-containing protein 1 n=1 Tax=Galdieria sulphuraria TaxID=130081 RepID=M2XW49_GALSU|nr:uncharacterized protein Gasu_48080 [Galdieria sulphuraria]EME27664.1 hypothetical protein Gasu_48080 [Galdieria sulphuraria]GJD07446.1 hypothetical protein Gasu2_18060 [Galdieria sulphuraria]|eukprot:XP_005704184.1 hypothetical protein Gasu_48080 [Galdieria sulphuraria]
MSIEYTSIRNVAVQLRSLSADTENQPIIAREEGCMAALVGFIEGNDSEIVRIAVEAILDLTSHPDNAEVMKSERGLVSALKALVTDFDRADIGTRQSAHACLVNLLVRNSKESQAFIAEELASLANKGGLGGKEAFDSSLSTVLKPKAQNCLSEQNHADLVDVPFLPQTLTIRLYVRNVSDEDVQYRVERLLVMTRGVVSVSFEIGTETVIVRSRIAAEYVRKAIELRGGFPAEIIDEEVYIEKENNQLRSNEALYISSDGPKYLDEMPSRSRLSWSWQRGDKIIVPGNGGVTLAERLEAQRKEEAKKRARATRLVNRIGKSFVSGFGFW